ncbi:ubiquitin-conjugating enzyme domain-containing protein [Cyclospora cayetanensis]|uniref:Ubiquitin-conjugating enzyme domain-containing protein n=1 Tax=Cyclospora cayetanensis TaxID=88456 RepID=A0A1D3D4H2_9EIME|nr:ubiquitin-conjugating enzyme domain-containing protein [Cyclospora cayetanensis]
MGNTQRPGVQGEGMSSNSRRPCQVQWSRNASHGSSVGNSSTTLATAPTARRIASAVSDSPIIPFSPEQGREELRCRWEHTTMFKRQAEPKGVLILGFRAYALALEYGHFCVYACTVEPLLWWCARASTHRFDLHACGVCDLRFMVARLERERAAFIREHLDGIVLVLPQEYADCDDSDFLSAAHPPSTHEQPQNEAGQENPATATSCSSHGGRSSSCSKNSRASHLLSRFPPALLRYKAGEPEGIKWLVAIEGAPETVYSKQPFLLSFKFLPKYPIESPELVFVLPYVPLHPHVYSNGHICLSILYDQWSPALGVKACCFSVLSMLSSNRERRPPPDDQQYCESRGRKGPKGVKWYFHDDTV